MKRIKSYILTFLAGMLTWHILLLSFDTFLHRSGTIGGEVLVLPLIAAVFYLGWMAREEITKITEVGCNGNGGEENGSNYSCKDGRYDKKRMA